MSMRLIPHRAVLVRALAGDFVLCSWARHFMLNVPVSIQVYKWVLANVMLGINQRWGDREGRKGRCEGGRGGGRRRINTISHLTSLQKPEMSVILMGHLARLEG